MANIKNFRKEQYIREDLENELTKFVSNFGISSYLVSDLKRKYHILDYFKKDDYYVFNVQEKGWDKQISILDMFEIDDWKVTGEYDPSTAKHKLKALPRELKAAIKEFIEFYRYTHDPHYEEKLQKMRDNMQLLSIDENDRVVTKAQWLEAADNCDDIRSHGDSRAVVIDDSTVCINASAAIEKFSGFEEFREKKKVRDPRKDGDLLYDACEVSNGTFKGHRVRYAERDEILAQIEMLNM